MNFIDPTGEFLISSSTLLAYVYGPTIINAGLRNAHTINKAVNYVFDATSPGHSNALGAISVIGPDNIIKGIVQSFEATGNYLIDVTDYTLRRFPHDAIDLIDDMLSALLEKAAQKLEFNNPYNSGRQSELYWTAEPSACTVD